MTGLVRPTRGSISVMGLSPDDPDGFFRTVGYCTQFDSFPRGLSGREFVRDGLMLHGIGRAEVRRLTDEALDRVQLGEAADRKIAGYSKGMRQKVRLAQAIAHHPRVLILDEPLNGLDPMARAESMALFEELGRQGMHLVLSSHILDEVDRLSDRVVLITGRVPDCGRQHPAGAAGGAGKANAGADPMRPAGGAGGADVCGQRVRGSAAASRMGGGSFLRTGDIDRFYSTLNQVAVEGAVRIDSVAPADDDADAIYRYLIGTDGGAS